MATSPVTSPFTQRGWSGHFTYQFPAAISRIPNKLAESYLTGTLFRQILARSERLAWHPA
jgi:hypothetical protein